MEKEVLERMLAEGLSLEEIGRSLGRHPATVGYWVSKYGLKAAGRDLHRPKGCVSEVRLRALVERDLSQRQIAVELGVSQATVRYWLTRFSLRTTSRARRRRVPTHALERRAGHCAKHGDVEFVVTRNGDLICTACRANKVTEWRRRAKRTLVAEAGGACALCGYDELLAALEFHHLDPATKRFGIGTRGLARNIAALREEAAKCVLLCTRCHVEVENGHRELPANMLPAPQRPG
jgi:transposase